MQILKRLFIQMCKTSPISMERKIHKLRIKCLKKFQMKNILFQFQLKVVFSLKSHIHIFQTNFQHISWKLINVPYMRMQFTCFSTKTILLIFILTAQPNITAERSNVLPRTNTIFPFPNALCGKTNFTDCKTVK